MFQKVRQSLKDNNDIRMLEKLAEVTEPGDIKVSFQVIDDSISLNFAKKKIFNLG